MRLYLGNATKQHVDFYYRLPEDNPKQPARKMRVRHGEQEMLPGEFSREVLDALLAPYLRYGWAEASSVSRIRDFAGMLYSFDKIIPGRALVYTIASNDAKMDDAALEERTREAAAASHMNPVQLGPEAKPRAFDVELHDVARDGKSTPLQIAEVRQDAPVTRSGKRGKAAA